MSPVEAEQINLGTESWEMDLRKDAVKAFGTE